jgi:hypothetical protein
MSTKSNSAADKAKEIADVESPPEYDDVMLLSPLPPKMTSRGSSGSLNSLSRIGLLCSLMAFICLALTSFWLYGRLVYGMHGPAGHDVFQTKTSFRGTDGVFVEQHLSSSVTQNYVIYHVVKPNERMWIVDDFATNIQVMKVETGDESVCYVTSLNRSLSTQPSAYMSRDGEQNVASISSPLQQQRARVQTLFMASDQMIDPESLGNHAVDLCADTPVYWVTPITAVTTPSESVFGVQTREKRNVKKCIESCCFLVCCCNQKYLQWQSDDSFNCQHVCKGCTPKSLTSIREMC